MSNKNRPPDPDPSLPPSSPASGTLYIVATPIGNLGDLSPRAVTTLQSADCIFCEDTRTFSKLAQHYSIQTKLQSYHEHNERGKVAAAEQLLSQGATIALVSDAGTPLISDPGYHLVNLAHRLGVNVIGVPGPCAAVTALSISGFEPHRFIFEGFLPVKKLKRTQALASALSSESTVIFYESPHRVVSTLLILEELCPEVEVCIGRELTKLHEELLLGTAKELRERLEQRASIKGEIVLLIRAAAKGFRYRNSVVSGVSCNDAPGSRSEPKIATSMRF